MALNAISDEHVTVSSASIGITAPSAANRCYVEVTANAIYYTFDGGTPASSNGGEANAGDVIDIMGYGHHDMKSVMENFKMIRQSADATAKVHYFD